jgi:hypothetical protein
MMMSGRSMLFRRVEKKQHRGTNGGGAVGMWGWKTREKWVPDESVGPRHEGCE